MTEKVKSPFGRSCLAGLMLALTVTLCIFFVIYAANTTRCLIQTRQDARLREEVGYLMPPEATAEDVTYRCRMVNNKAIGGKMPLFVAYRGAEIVGYMLVHSTNQGYSAPLVLITGFDAQKRIYKMDIKESNETPGFGDKADRSHGSFLDRFDGKDLNARFETRQNGGDFDAITGSTITSRAIILSAGDALKAINDITNPEGLPECSKH